MNERVEAILNFWFVESSREQHFKKSIDFDRKINKLFKSDYLKAIKNELEDWQDNHKSCLALIILLDQFSRNLYRNNPKAFQFDQKTRLIANESIDRGDLNLLNDNERFFLILPLIHSEDISDHVFVHNICDIYLKSHPNFKEIKIQFDYHTLAIKKFGRYPHRNKILGRESTAAEKEFLNQPNSSW